MSRRWITDDQLRSKLGGCSRSTLWRLRQQGVISPAEKLGARSARNLNDEDRVDRQIAAALRASEDGDPP